MENITLPEDGTEVTALTYPSIEYDREAEEVSGPLKTRYVYSLDYTQCWVNGVQVDPETVRLSERPIPKSPIEVKPPRDTKSKSSPPKLQPKPGRIKGKPTTTNKDLPQAAPFASEASHENLDETGEGGDGRMPSPEGINSQVHEFDSLKKDMKQETPNVTPTPTPTTQILLYLVRHGDTDLNSANPNEDRIRGWRNVALNDEGREEALTLERWFQDKKLSFIFSSDLDRTEETAYAIARSHNLSIASTSSLRPWDVGKYTGAISSATHPILEEYARDYPSKKLPPGPFSEGESFDEFKTRVLTFIRDKLKNQVQRSLDPSLLVSHFRDLKLALSWVEVGSPDNLDVDLDDFLKWDKSKLQPGAVLILGLDNSSNKIIAKIEQIQK